MAIEVTRLSAADGRDISVIKSWFDANADELYKGIDCTFTADGNEYLYNGFIAMR
jgi:hypothetical protein